jgi:nucleoside-diphosphate-sugar epimerase
MKLFLTGATGYIGGSAAVKLVAAGHQVVGLTRDATKAPALRALGMEVSIGALSDRALLADAARAADAVIHTADADNRAAVEVFLNALAGSGKRFIHTSGSSIVATDALGELLAPVYDEDTPFTPDPGRAARVGVDTLVRQAAQRGVHSIVICPSLIYGEGLGVGKLSIQVPRLAQAARAAGAGVYIGRGENRWANVHIEDLADLYVLALEKAPAGSFYFAENGEASFQELAVAISKLLGFGGRTQSISIEQAAAQWGDTRARYSLASNSRVRARKARELGWRPHRVSLLEEVAGAKYLL